MHSHVASQPFDLVVVESPGRDLFWARDFRHVGQDNQTHIARTLADNKPAKQHELRTRGGYAQTGPPGRPTCASSDDPARRGLRESCKMTKFETRGAEDAKMLAMVAA